MDLKEIRLRIPELKEQVKPGEALTSLHLAFGGWIILRDLRREFGVLLGNIPAILFPDVIVGLISDDADLRAQCGEVVRCHLKKHALLGIPIHGGGHWTLLVFQRSRGKEFKLVEEKLLNIRYYDTLSTFSEA